MATKSAVDHEIFKLFKYMILTLAKSARDNDFKAEQVGPRMTGILKRREVVFGLIGLALSSSSSVALASGKPEDFVKALMNRVIGLANSGARGKPLRQRFASLLDSYVNLRSISTFALGKYQKQLPDRDRAEFNNLVANYAAALFAYYVDDFKGEGVSVSEISSKGNFTTIKSSIVSKSGGEEQVRWRLVKQGNSYRVSDVNIKGIWMTLSMRKRFNDVLGKSKGDFKVLFAELREAETW